MTSAPLTGKSDTSASHKTHKAPRDNPKGLFYFGDDMDKILTVRQPYASALVHGVKDREYRAFRIPKGTKVWVHAGMQLGMQPLEIPDWFREIGATKAAEYLDWTSGKTDTRPEGINDDALANAIWESLGLPKPMVLPFGVVIGYVVFGDSYATEGDESTLGKYANKVDSFHAIKPREWKVHKGSLGLMPFGGI